MHYAKRIPVLMYHRVGEPDHPHDVYCIHPARFAAQIRDLAEAGYRAVSIEDFDAWWRGKKSLPENSFVLTFDDGFTGVHDFAAPILKSLDWPATVFLVAGKLGGQSNWAVTTAEPMQPHPLMDTVQLSTLAGQGFSLQSHSLQHHDLTTLDASQLAEDLRDSRAIIAKLFDGHTPRFLAYPYGRHNESVRHAAQQAGFSSAFTVESGFNRPGDHPYRLRRLDIFGTDTPAMLLRKIRFGTNDGTILPLMTYYLKRLLRLN